MTAAAWRCVRIAALLTAGMLHVAAAPNHLAGQESPYLIMHRDNPVDWYPWGDEPFETARREGKLVFVSIGFSTCHWCAVMEKESFDDNATAAVINQYAVAVKVDREERPQIDSYYQRLYMLMHGRSGGWPLHVLMTPDKIPLYTATYMPPVDRDGQQGIATLLPRLAQRYATARQTMTTAGQQLLDRLDRPQDVPSGSSSMPPDRGGDALVAVYDPVNGGFGTFPKFPQSSAVEWLLDRYAADRNVSYASMARKTLDRMATKGLYDHVEGGFFRYATDSGWEIPHFEKMLYTNAQLIALYSRAYAMFRTPRYRDAVLATFAHFEERFRTGEFYKGGSHADSFGGEGGYFLFTYDQAAGILRQAGWTPRQIDRFCRRYSITPEGNFEESNQLMIDEDRAASPEDAQGLALLARERRHRPYPFVDEKIIVSWNAMMAAGLLQSGSVSPLLVRRGSRMLDALWSVYDQRRGVPHILNQHYGNEIALLEDYAWMTAALLARYEAAHGHDDLEHAVLLGETMRRLFFADGVWYLSSDRRVTADVYDKYMTSPVSVAVDALAKIALYTDDLTLYRSAQGMVRTLERQIAPMPLYQASALRLADRSSRGELIVKGNDRMVAALRPLLEHAGYAWVVTKIEHESGTLSLCMAGSCLQTAATPEEMLQTIKAFVRRKETSEGSQGEPTR